MWIKCSSKRINLADMREYNLDDLTIIFIRFSGEEIKLSFRSTEDAEEAINIIDSYTSESEFLLDFSQFFYGKKINDFLSS